jgi:hypothetical protein
MVPAITSINTKQKTGELACLILSLIIICVHSQLKLIEGFYHTYDDDDHWFQDFTFHVLFMKIFFLQIFCVPDTTFPYQDFMQSSHVPAGQYQQF